MKPEALPREQTEDLVQIRRAALDYMQGWYEADAERMGQSLHPELAKRRLLRDPQSGEEGFRHITKQLIVELTQQGGGSDDAPADRRYYDVTVLDIFGDIASVKADSYDYVDYLHLARSQGRWLIVNVLYQVKDDPTSGRRESS